MIVSVALTSLFWRSKEVACAMMHMWRPKDNFQELLLSFLCVSSGVLVSGHLYSSNCLYLLSHLIYHLFSFKISIYSHKIPSCDSFYFIQWILLCCSYIIFFYFCVCLHVGICPNVNVPTKDRRYQMPLELELQLKATWCGC